MHIIKRIILSIPILKRFGLFIKWIIKSFLLYLRTRKELINAKNISNRIFYIGIPAHENLGDLAQGVCIRKWLKKHYPERKIVEIETNALVNTKFSLLYLFKQLYNENDFIVFQSGYTTTDLGGFADEMHRAVIDAIPDAKILMFPQTIFFVSDENKRITSQSYNSNKKMLFLARDAVSHVTAEEMFPDLNVVLYPDIVTTLIGSKDFENERNGILFCCRNDGEKYYSDEEILNLISKLEKNYKVNKTDTTKRGKTSEIVNNAEYYIKNEIEEYSKYKLIITDRYHGTIFSLVAGTPVIILKTTDHKVTTGADWFKGIYDSYVYLANDLNDAYNIALKVLSSNINYKLDSYFEREYYDKLPELFEKTIIGDNI